MDFKYTDLSKVKNFIGFESGVICFFPPYDSLNIKSGDDYKISVSERAQKLHKERYGGECPKHYDPRCRNWYVDQYGKDHSTFTDVYTFSNGDLGISNCVPLWGTPNKNGERKYHGAYCFD